MNKNTFAPTPPMGWNSYDYYDTAVNEEQVKAIEAVKPIMDMPNLPVARVMWKAYPDLCTGAKLWIMAGGAHHTVLSFDATAQMLEDWADIMGIEYVHIGKDTTVEGLKQQIDRVEYHLEIGAARCVQNFPADLRPPDCVAHHRLDR